MNLFINLYNLINDIQVVVTILTQYKSHSEFSTNSTLYLSLYLPPIGMTPSSDTTIPVEDKTTSDKVVWTLLIGLIILVLLLVLLYKKLNKDTSGQYTIRRMVHKDGGIRDRVRGAVVVLETRLGIRLWPQSEGEEEGEEMQDVRDEEGDADRGDERGESEGEEEKDEGEGRGDNSSDDYSSLEGSDLRERAKLTGQEDAKGEMEGKTEEKRAEKGESREDGGSQEGKEGGEGGGGGGGGMLIDLKQFSGSAIWSEDKKDEQDKENDMTAL